MLRKLLDLFRRKPAHMPGPLEIFQHQTEAEILEGVFEELSPFNCWPEDLGPTIQDSPVTGGPDDRIAGEAKPEPGKYDNIENRPKFADVQRMRQEKLKTSG